MPDGKVPPTPPYKPPLDPDKLAQEAFIKSTVVQLITADLASGTTVLGSIDGEIVDKAIDAAFLIGDKINNRLSK